MNSNKRMAELYEQRANGDSHLVQVIGFDEWVEFDGEYEYKRDYKLAPKTRTINSIEVPDCLRVEPERGETCYLSSSERVFKICYEKEHHQHYFIHGLLFCNKIKAEESRTALLSITRIDK